MSRLRASASSTGLRSWRRRFSTRAIAVCSLLRSRSLAVTRLPRAFSAYATLAVPEPRLITIQPWDTSIIGEIEKAILKSELGLTPMNDGKMIRIPIPPLTENRRKELVKVAKKTAEEGKIAIRNHRRESNELLKELKNEKEISEDDFFRAQEEVQNITDEYIKKVDQITAEKEKEIMEF